MNQAGISRQNHYVPVWYQKGFIVGDRRTLQYLDRDPPVTKLRDGRTIVGKKLESPPLKKCFREKDLYTTRFGPLLNDDVERFLFGAIDTTGANAVRAFSSGDPLAIHRSFTHFFEYVDAQKLRTPKGLDWIKSRYPSLTQIALMRELQHLRRMHCTMWVECVREIVSAENSDVKFIVTDHPVTAYNVSLPPPSSSCAYPEDPSIGLKGTQTIFALDADHCLILTNLEYAQDPTGVDVKALRQNARFGGQTLARTDAMIRTRKLTRDEATSINFLLKSRSRRYLAAYEEAWLFPENVGSIEWEHIGKVLLPPKDKLWGFGGEIYVGYKDGATGYQDAFGRTDTRHQYLRKKERVADIALSDPCGCGSGRKYKRCCNGIDADNRAPWDVYSIRDRNLTFCNAIVDILGLAKGKTWQDVRRELSDDQVKRIHETVELLWPSDTNLAHLLPRPDPRVFRTVYMGLIDPRTITESVISSLAYFDEIILVNPFPNPGCIAPEYSPTKVPGQYKSQTLKNVSALLTLEPFIDAGLIHLLPNQAQFNADFGRALMKMSAERAADFKLTEHEMQRGVALARDDMARYTLRLPEDALRSKIRESQPEVSPQLVEHTIAYMKEKLVSDPFALLQPVKSGEDGAEFQVLNSMSLEFALFVAQLTGSAICTDEPGSWRQLHEHTSSARSSTHPASVPIAKALKKLALPIELNPLINLEARQSGALARMRRTFRKIWGALAKSADEGLDEVARNLAVQLESDHANVASEWAACATTAGPSTRLQRYIELSAPTSGFDLNTVHRLLITTGRTNHIRSVPMALFLTFGNVAPETSEASLR